MDIAVSPYAGGLRERGKSKRAWDVGYIESFQHAKDGDPVRFELTNGVMAAGSVKIIQLRDGAVSYVSGELTAPEAGRFFFLTPPAGGKAGKAVGVVEFPASKTAYRIEPTAADGAPEFWQRRLDEVICMDMPAVDPAKLQAAQDAAEETGNIVPLRPDLVPYYVPSYNSDIVSLQSYPGSPAVLLLDFAGGYTSGWGGVTYARPNVSNDTIKDVWKRVAEDYMPFNINVTTDIKVFQAAPAASRQRCCFTTTPVTAAGVAYFGSWNWGNDTVCWSVYCAGKAAAEVGAHEPGHTLGLAHQTQDFPDGTHNEYYGGQGGGQTGWAPIMGVGYYQALSTWAKGEFNNASQHQDELQTITTANNNVHYRSDDTGDTLATSRYLEINNDHTVFAEGVIERSDDTDAFQFTTTTGGAVSLTVSPVAVGDWGDLATMASLADASDAVIASNNAQDQVSSTITANLPAGTYTFRVTGAGKNDPVTNGFSSYASLGYYSISGSVAGARMPSRLSVAEHAANNTVVGSVAATNPNGSPLVYAIAAGNTGPTFSVDNSGVVRVADNTLLDYYALAANPSLYAAQFELFMNITNVNNPALTESNRRVVVAVQQLYAPVPTTLTATLDSSLRIDLAWAGSFGATRYHVKRSTTHGGPYTTLASPTGTSYTDGALTNGVTYYYVVSAVNANGESYNSTEAGSLALTVAGGFESPIMSAGTFQYNPTGGGGWTFAGTSPSGSGIVSNGSGFSNPNAPEGVQAAFIQEFGAISQTFAGFTPGTLYTISYAAAQRGSQTGESWNVVIDGTVIKTHTPGSTNFTSYSATFTATTTTHTLAFVGTDLAGGDNTVFIDNVQISVATPILNSSFEAPGIGTGNYRYNPTGGSWAFNGASPNGSGIVANGSGFSNPNAPLGTQAAFIQEFGSISQTLSGLTIGKTYTLGYSAAQRAGSNGGESWNVKIDSSVIQSNSPGSTSYTPYTAIFVATAATHTLTFVGTDLAGGDNTVFIDNVTLSLLSPLQPVAAGVALANPANNSVFAAHAPVNLAASVTANGNLINGVQFYIDDAMISQSANAPYSCAWANAGEGAHSMVARVLFNNGSFADSIPVDIVVANANPNLGFESPSLGSGNYSASPGGASWTFDATGIAANGSGFNNPNAPEGSQTAWVQRSGSLSQSLSGFVPGTSYTLTYSAAQRGAVQNGGQTWNVDIDGTAISSNNPGAAATSFTTYTASFTASAVAHTLAFTGTNLNGGDNTVFIDKVSISPPLATTPTPTLMSDTLPASAADVVGSQVTLSAAFSSTQPVTYQWQKIVGGQLTDIAGATTPTLTVSNLQLSDTGLYRLEAANSFGSAVSTAIPLTVSSAAAAVANVITSYAAQTGLGSVSGNFSPTWTVAPGSLIAGQSPSAVGGGNFEHNVGVLTDGTFGRLTYGLGAPTVTQVSCGNTNGGQSVTYTLAASAGGYALSNIVVYGGWCDAGRDQQAYTVYYSTVADPTNFVLLASVDYNPANPDSVQSATRATLSSASAAPLASNVAALKFDFTTPTSENGYCGYSEIAAYGTSVGPVVTTNTLPASAADVVGGQVTFTAAITGTAPLSYQWKKVTNGVASNISGATNATLTLTNLQLSDTASYQLQASNANGVALSSPSSLKVNSVAAAVNNVVTSMAAQTGLGGFTNFLPSWPFDTSNSLIAGMAPTSSTGNFSLDTSAATASALTAGDSLAIAPTAGGDSGPNYLSCGNAYGSGSSVVYTLPASAGGYGLTQIMVYGGWRDAGRDQQAYTVSYSTVAAPATFIALGTVNYNPANPAAVQSATRATLTPATGVLAANVAAVKFDFTTPASENGWVGYSEIAVYGTPVPSTPTGLAAVAGNAQTSLSWTAASGATSYNVKRATLSGGPYTTVASPTGSSYINTGLTNGTTYYYVVSAVNAGGASANSGQVNATPQVPAPPAPTGLAAVAGNAQTSLSWTAASGATSYKVKRATLSGGPYTTVASPTGTSYINTGLTNGTTYYYVVSAVNAGGESANTSQVNATPQVPAPPAPIGLAVTPGNAQASVSWTAASGATSYNVKRSTVSGGSFTTVASPTGSSYINTGLTNGTTYYYVVSAVNAGGESANSGQINATPQVPAPPAPIGLAATPGNAQASVSWTAASGATSYNVKRSTVSGGPYTNVASPTGSSYINTGLTNGTIYYYVVSAVNAGGESANSGQVNATPVLAGYEAWLADYPSLIGADQAPDADPDHDGVPNGIEFLTGTSPLTPAGAGPISTTLDSAGNLVLHFKRVVAAKSYAVAVESATSLDGPWASLVLTNGAITGPPLTVVENGTAADDVTVVIASAGAPRKFARLRITIPVTP